MTDSLTREAALNWFSPSDEGFCPHGVPFAPGRADSQGRSQWCGECFPEEGERG